MDEVNCTGNEHDVRNCAHGGWKQSDCGHNEDAGVRCHHPHAQKPDVSMHTLDCFITLSSNLSLTATTAGRNFGPPPPIFSHCQKHPLSSPNNAFYNRHRGALLREVGAR